MRAFKYIKHILSLFKRGTFLDYIIYYLKAIQKVKQLKKIDFSNITIYFKENSNSVKSDRNVLLEFFSDYPVMVHNICNRNLFLENIKNTNSIALLQHNSDIKMKYLAKVYGINKFVSVYTYKNILYRYMSLIFLIKNFKFFKYKKTYGWSIVCEGIEIGDLIYDQFLRFTNLPTYRKIDLRFLLYIYNSIILFYRYKDILIENKITDIILSHDVYADYGIFFRVAYLVDPDIKFYNGDTINLGYFTVQNATNGHIKKPRVLYKHDKVAIFSKFPKEELLKEYENIMLLRTSGKNYKDIDNSNVYLNTDINSIEELKSKYAVHQEGKNFFVYSHAFVDAVRYFETLYSDYYTWLYETLILLSKKTLKHNFYVKAHPSEHFYKCDVTVKSVVDEINTKYGAKFIYLDKKINNNVVFKYADACFTCTGSIAFEAPCFGVPVFTASNFMEEVKTTINSMTIDEYKRNLETIDNLQRLSDDAIERARLYFILFDKYFLIDLENSINDVFVDSYKQYEFINSSILNSPKVTEQVLFRAFKHTVANNFLYTYRNEV
jgi:hypothetical protein